MGRRQEPGFVEVIVGNSYGARDSDLADAARRYAAEQDFADWGDRLSIYGLDLRHTPSVERFFE